MANKGLYGVNTYRGITRRKRPGRHKKSLNKHEKRQKKGWQTSYNILYYSNGSWVWTSIITAHKKMKGKMNIYLKEADQKELMAYQIALLTLQVNINNQLTTIKNKLNKLKEKEKYDK